MMQASCYGRLGQAPRSIETRSGNSMAVASVAVDVSDSRDGEEQPPEWLGIVAFGKVADDLLRHQKGDLLSLSGRVQRNNYTTRDGEQRQQLQVVVDSVISARTTRPKGGRKRQEGPAQSKPDPEPAGADPDLNDPLPDF